MSVNPPIKLFIIYAREDQPELLELKAHLRPLEKQGDLTVWYDGEILPGQEWDKAIKAELEAADIVLLLISKHFFNSEYIEKEELQKALERHKKSQTVITPVIMRPCVWDAHPEISSLQVLPKDGKPISTWGDVDEAFSDVVRGIQKLIKISQANIAFQKVEEAILAYEAGQKETAFQMLSQYAVTEYSINPRAYSLLGLLYEHGQGGAAINRDKAMELFRKAAEQGDSYGQLFLGVKYFYGNDGVPKDYTEAAKWYQKSAEQGNALGQISIGDMYKKGLGILQDNNEAIKWIRKAAEQGNEYGQVNLANMYKDGHGAVQNYSEAVRWYRKAADQENAWGQTCLATMYENGQGVPKDLPTAIQWYRKASAQGYNDAKENLQRLGYSE